VLGAIAAYKTWKDFSGKGEHGTFTGVCTPLVLTGWLVLPCLAWLCCAPDSRDALVDLLASPCHASWGHVSPG
jgi:hypothetical protein